MRDERMLLKVKVIDSHTGGEPTRVVIDGAPDLGAVSAAERRRRLQAEHTRMLSAIVNEPRGSDVLVGAMLFPPADPTCIAAVVFFNTVGCLGMCGHGTIGVVQTLYYLNRIAPGTHRLETPVGPVTVEMHPDGAVSVRNVPAYRWLRDAVVEVPGTGAVTGDVAWGGNWFFLVQDHGQELRIERVEALTAYTRAIRTALADAGITGEEGAVIDHIELFGPSPVADSRNFVLCPGSAYDRSPCGTGTSAKLACLCADGKLAEGQVWRQESITGSLFEGTIETEGDRIVPTIRGRAWITAEATLILDTSDPLCWGIPAGAAV